MLTKKIVVLCGGALALALIGGVYWVGAQPPEKRKNVRIPTVLKGKPKEHKVGDDEMRRLLIARYNVALLEAQKRLGKDREDGSFATYFAVGATDLCVKRLFEAEFALAENAAERLSACANYMELARTLEADAMDAVQDGIPLRNSADMYSCQYLRADAGVRLSEAKRQAAAK